MSNQEQTVFIKGFEKEHEAHLALGLLRSHGIDAFLGGEHTHALYPLSNQEFQIKLFAFLKDAERAKELLSHHEVG